MAAGRRAQEHRHDPPIAQFTREIVEDEVLRRIDVADQLLHQRIVIIGELLEHEIARLFFLRDHARWHLDDAGRGGLAIDEGPLEREIDKSSGDAILPDRNLAQQKRGARGRLKHLKRLAQAPVRLIDLVEEQDARQPKVFQFAKNDLERWDLARIGLAYDDGGVADGQGVAHVMDEFDRAGGIEKGEPVAEIVDAGDIGLDAHRVAARLRARIADAGAFAHRPLPRDAAAAGQEFPQEGWFCRSGTARRS